MQRWNRAQYWAVLGLLVGLGATSEGRAQFAASDPSEAQPLRSPSNAPSTLRTTRSGRAVAPAGGADVSFGDSHTQLDGDAGAYADFEVDGQPGPAGRFGASTGRASAGGRWGQGATAVGRAGRGGMGGASARDVERGYDRSLVGSDNGNGGGHAGQGLNSAADGELGATGGLFNSMGSLGRNDNGGGRNSSHGGSNSAGAGLEGALNSFGGAAGGRSENANGNGNRRSNGGPAENGNAGGGRASAGAGAVNLPARGNSAGSGSARSHERNGNEARANNSGREAPNSQKDKSGADGEDRSARNDSNANQNGGSRGRNSDAREGNSQDAAKAGAPDRPEDEGWSAASDPVGKAAARRRYGDVTANARGRDPLGAKRDAEAVDGGEAMRRIGGRVDPLTGAVGVMGPVGDGVSPQLRSAVETAKKRKQGQ